VAGPVAGMTLAQMGADVIRFDPIGGGLDHRRWPITKGGRSLYWAGLNKGKRSIAADIRSDEGRELIVSLITEGRNSQGIFLTNLDYPWLRYEGLRRLRHDVIVMRIVGNRQGSPAVDYTVNATIGYPLVTGPATAELPVNHVLPAWDLLTGLHAAVGLLAAEGHRRVTGRGQQVDLALSDVAMATIGHLGLIAEVEVNQSERGRYGNFVYGTFGSDFKTEDGRVMVAPMTPRQWEALCTITSTRPKLERLAEESGLDLSDEGARFELREQIADILAPWFMERSTDRVGALLDANAIPWGRYQTFSQLVAEDSRCSVENPMFDVVDQPGIGRYRAPRSPLGFENQLQESFVRAPNLGGHTNEVLMEVLGLTEVEVGRLNDRGVVMDAS